MVRHTLKALQHLLQDFKSVSEHFTTLRSKGLSKSRSYVMLTLPYSFQDLEKFQIFGIRICSDIFFKMSFG